MAESLFLTVFLDLQDREGQVCFLFWKEHVVLSYPLVFELCVLRSQNHTGTQIQKENFFGWQERNEWMEGLS